ncbi:hypothetical protein BDN72DRAFT_52195 [Pluteus cervinus]|uniref:Uncharacterized protein n=1 Tax=Pluteus cervinus TaxID=181527 RepID=A0ACD3B9M4_9AGAR|nr:hypothetical protein BDN72DRAFT_52195 [Pluteus cervinus]
MASQSSQEQMIFIPLLDNPLHSPSLRPQSPPLPHQASSLRTSETKIYHPSNPVHISHKGGGTKLSLSLSQEDERALLNPKSQAGASKSQEDISHANLLPLCQWKLHQAIKGIVTTNPASFKTLPIQAQEPGDDGGDKTGLLEDVIMEGQDAPNKVEEDIKPMDMDVATVEVVQPSQPSSPWNAQNPLPLQIQIHTSQLPTNTTTNSSGPTTINVNISFFGAVGPESQPGSGNGVSTMPPMTVTATVVGPPTNSGLISSVGTPIAAQPTLLPEAVAGVSQLASTPKSTGSTRLPSTPQRRPLKLPIPDPSKAATPRRSGSLTQTPERGRTQPPFADYNDDDNNTPGPAFVRSNSIGITDDSGRGRPLSRTTRSPSFVHVNDKTETDRALASTGTPSRPTQDGNLKDLNVLPAVPTESPATLVNSTAQDGAMSASATFTSTSATSGVSPTNRGNETEMWAERRTTITSSYETVTAATAASHTAAQPSSTPSSSVPPSTQTRITGEAGSASVAPRASTASASIAYENENSNAHVDSTNSKTNATSVIGVSSNLEPDAVPASPSSPSSPPLPSTSSTSNVVVFSHFTTPVGALSQNQPTLSLGDEGRNVVNRSIHPLPLKPTWIGQSPESRAKTTGKAKAKAAKVNYANLLGRDHRDSAQSGSTGSVATGSGTVSGRPKHKKKRRKLSSSGTPSGALPTNSSDSNGSASVSQQLSGAATGTGISGTGSSNPRDVAMNSSSISSRMRGSESVMSPISDPENLERRFGSKTSQKRKREEEDDEEDDEAEDSGLEDRQMVPTFEVIQPVEQKDDGDDIELEADDLDVEALSIQESDGRPGSAMSIEEGEIHSDDEPNLLKPPSPAPSHFQMRSPSVEDGEIRSRLATPTLAHSTQNFGPPDTGASQQARIGGGILDSVAQNIQRGPDFIVQAPPNLEISEPMDVGQDPIIVEPTTTPPPQSVSFHDEAVQGERYEMDEDQDDQSQNDVIELDDDNELGSSHLLNEGRVRALMEEIFGDGQDDDEPEIVYDSQEQSKPVQADNDIDDDDEVEFVETQRPAPVEDKPTESTPWYASLATNPRWKDTKEPWDFGADITAGPSMSAAATKTTRAIDLPKTENQNKNSGTPSTPSLSRGRQPTVPSGGSRKSIQSTKSKSNASGTGIASAGPSTANLPRRKVKAYSPLYSNSGVGDDQPPSSDSEDEEEYDELDEEDDKPSTSRAGYNTPGRKRNRSNQKPHSTSASSSKRSSSRTRGGGQGRRPRSSSNPRSRSLSLARSSGSGPRSRSPPPSPPTLIKLIGWKNTINSVHYILTSKSNRRNPSDSTTVIGKDDSQKLFKVFSEIERCTSHPKLTMLMLADSQLVAALKKFKHTPLENGVIELTDKVRYMARRLIRALEDRFSSKAGARSEATELST